MFGSLRRRFAGLDGVIIVGAERVDVNVDERGNVKEIVVGMVSRKKQVPHRSFGAVRNDRKLISGARSVTEVGDW